MASLIMLVFLIDDARFVIRRSQAREPHPAPTDWRVLLSRPIIMNFIFCLWLALAAYGLQNFLVVGLGALHGTDAVAANAALSGYLLMSALGILLGGWFANRTTQHRLLAALGLSGTVIAALLMANFDLSGTLLFVMMSIAGLLYGSVMPARDMIVREVTPPGAFGTVFGFVTNGFNIAGILAPLIFGALLDRGEPRIFFYVVAAFGVASIISVMCVPHRRAG